jgi:hypothetical protein
MITGKHNWHSEVIQFTKNSQFNSSKKSTTPENAQMNSKQQITQHSVEPKCKETYPSTL